MTARSDAVRRNPAAGIIQHVHDPYPAKRLSTLRRWWLLLAWRYRRRFAKSARQRALSSLVLAGLQSDGVESPSLAREAEVRAARERIAAFNAHLAAHAKKDE